MESTLQLPGYAGTTPIVADVSRWFAGIRRDGQTIRVSPANLVALYKLDSGRSYVAEYSDRTLVPRFVFFGTDEAAFVTGVSGKALAALKTGGESAFFTSLIPPFLKTLADELGCSLKRQGDIYTLPLAPTFEEAISMLSSKCLLSDKRIMTTVTNRRLFFTRHRFQGELLLTKRLEHYKAGKTKRSRRLVTSSFDVVLAKGVLKAPDHKPLELDDQVHLVSLSANTWDTETRPSLD